MEDDAYLYALEKYAVAVHELVGAADIRVRLHDACLSVLPLSPRQLPEHVHDKHEALKDALTWVPVEEPGEGKLLSTLRVMDDTEADRLAKTFFEVYTTSTTLRTTRGNPESREVAVSGPAQTPRINDRLADTPSSLGR